MRKPGGAGWYQRSLPPSSTIIAARWPLLGARKMLPLARPLLRVSTLIDAGVKPLTEWKLEPLAALVPSLLLPSPALLPPLVADFLSSLGKTPTLKRTAPCLAPTSFLLAFTETVSPGLNDLSGKKLAPLPS